jgi:hypothetical protein
VVVRLARRALRHINVHFEVVFYAYLWLNASLLAALVGRPWLAAVGLVTVAPFIVGYITRARRGR